MDCAECNEEKGLDCRGSASECRFNFAFLPSAWIKARARLTEQMANIFLCRWKGSEKFYRAWRRTQPPAFWHVLLFLFGSVTLYFSQPHAYRSFFTMSFIGLKKMIPLCITFGEREMLFLLPRERERFHPCHPWLHTQVLSVFHRCWLPAV